MIELTYADRVAIKQAAYVRGQPGETVLESVYVAGIRAGLERAAKVCDRVADETFPGYDDNREIEVAYKCAAAILALAADKDNPSKKPT